MENLLLVEDDPNIGRIAARKLEQELNMSVAWAQTLGEALHLMEKTSGGFSAAVLDYVLPDAMHGEVIDTVVDRGIPSVIFTSSISTDIRDTVWSKKVVDYVLKDDPSSIDYLISSVGKLMSNRTTKVLLVDDSQFFRKVLSELLSIHQYRLLVATNAREALSTLKRHPDIKLVLTDFNMPGMNGCDLCKAIRKSHKKEDLAIIGISAEGDKTMAARFIKSGANDFIIKQSFLVEEFYCRINQCIENIDLIRQTKQAAVSDFLTGLYNRRFFFEQGKLLFKSAEKSGLPLACVMMDIDYFKRVNDTYGHEAGDIVLVRIAELMREFSESDELVARLGGEEFSFLVPAPDALDSIGETSGDTLQAFRRILVTRFNDLREQIQATVIPVDGGAQSLSVTMSMGISFNTFENLSEMLKAADEQLYIAKQGGRNRVAVSTA